MQDKTTCTFTMSNIPSDLKKWLKDRAKSNNRSMSGEVITLFEKLRKGELKEI